MKRQIKFRGKRVDNGEWVYGSLDTFYDGSTSISYWVSQLLEPENNYWEPVQKYHDVMRESVGQYTGIEDKNGVEIYEGDIIYLEYYDGLPSTKGIELKKYLRVEYSSSHAHFSAR